ncbi:MAG: xanthine dehydrogenase family protein molybdopterin-binding subunit [Dehalococcoidia bacterium]|nr:xanthine dehydrogenase family protein molybdopterin-binding subunit [Dehalococcoidia bacterium]
MWILTTYKYVGSRIPRLEGHDKVTGRRTYAVDIKLPRMVHAKILRSPLAHAIIKHIDTTKAQAYPGVVAVVIGRDIPEIPSDTGTRYEAALAVDEVLFYGQPVAAVLAEEPYIAEEALDLIEVEYEQLPAIIDPVEAAREGAPLARNSLGDVDREEARSHHVDSGPAGGEEPTSGTNIIQRLMYQRGDIKAAFQKADLIIEHEWRASMTHQGYIEPQACVVDCSPMGEFTVWCSTQGPFAVREQVAKVLGVLEVNVTVEPVEMGGGFGGKTQGVGAVLAAILSRQVKRPVKYVMSRSDDLRAANPAPQAIIRLKTGATKEGKFVAVEGSVICDVGAFPGGPLMAICNSVAGFYDVEAYDIEGLEVMTNKVSVGALRAPGQPQGAFAIESQMDMMAKELGLDPLEFRINNAAKDETVPPSGRPWGSMFYKELLEKLAETDLWKSRSHLGPNQGIGVAGGGRMSGANRGNSIVVLNRDGTASVIVGQADITGINTSYAQIAAEELGLTIEQVQVFGGSTRSAPYAGTSAGSTSLRSSGRAVQQAAQDAKEQLMLMAANVLECNKEDLVAESGIISVIGSPDKTISIQALTMQTAGFGTVFPTIVGKGNIGAGRPVPTFTAVAVKVEVDPQTGEVAILDAVCVEDVGQAINPTLVEGQIQGGLSQALGIGLSEEMLWDEKGVLLNPSLLDYKMPTALDLPNLHAELMNFGAGLNELYGAKGVGEPPIIAGAAALANAVYNAVGARVHVIPVTAERILTVLGKV